MAAQRVRVAAGISAGIVAVLVTAALAGCSGSGGIGTSDSGGVATGDVAAGPAGVPAAAPSAAPRRAAGGSVASEQGATAPVLGAAKIRTAYLSVSVARAKDLEARADDAVALALRVGGEVDSDQRSGQASATLRLRVPPTDLTSSLTALTKLGKQTSRQVGTRDVTEQVADVTSRVASAQRAIARLRLLYADAAKVRDVIAIEQELSSRESDLESLQAQQRALSTQTSMATITLRLTVAAARPARKADRTGFLGGLTSGWDTFTRGLGATVTGIGAALPFAVLLLLLAGAARVVVVRRRRTVPVAE